MSFVTLDHFSGQYFRTWYLMLFRYKNHHHSLLNSFGFRSINNFFLFFFLFLFLFLFFLLLLILLLILLLLFLLLAYYYIDLSITLLSIPFVGCWELSSAMNVVCLSMCLSEYIMYQILWCRCLWWFKLLYPCMKYRKLFGAAWRSTLPSLLFFVWDHSRLSLSSGRLCTR